MSLHWVEAYDNGDVVFSSDQAKDDWSRIGPFHRDERVVEKIDIASDERVSPALRKIWFRPLVDLKSHFPQDEIEMKSEDCVCKTARIDAATTLYLTDSEGKRHRFDGYGILFVHPSGMIYWYKMKSSPNRLLKELRGCPPTGFEWDGSSFQERVGAYD